MEIQILCVVISFSFSLCGFLFLFLSFPPPFSAWFSFIFCVETSFSLSLPHFAWFSVFVALNGNQVNAYNGSPSAGQNERFGDKIVQETIGNRQKQEESDGYYPNTNDGSNITLTNVGMSYVYGPM